MHSALYLIQHYILGATQTSLSASTSSLYELLSNRRYLNRQYLRALVLEMVFTLNAAWRALFVSAIDMVLSYAYVVPEMICFLVTWASVVMH
jgi:hypothetical protein